MIAIAGKARAHDHQPAKPHRLHRARGRLNPAAERREARVRAQIVPARLDVEQRERFALLERTARQVFDDPKYAEAYAKTGAPIETSQYGNRELCNQYSKNMIALAEEYRELLTATKKG